MLIKAIKNWYLKDKKIILASVLLGFTVTALSAFISAGYSEEIHSGIARQVVRFHVLANSDSAEDQSLKLLVRDGVLADLKELLLECESPAQTKSVISANLDRVETCAKRIIGENGFDYPVRAAVVTDSFPTKQYGNVTLPAGEYEALRVEIGNAKGKNWWCVMFPPLCFVDITQPKLPDSAMEGFKNVLNDDEYGVVISGENGDSPYKARFKIVEIWQNIKEFHLF